MDFTLREIVGALVILVGLFLSFKINRDQHSINVLGVRLDGPTGLIILLIGAIILIYPAPQRDKPPAAQVAVAATKGPVKGVICKGDSDGTISNIEIKHNIIRQENAQIGVGEFKIVSASKDGTVVVANNGKQTIILDMISDAGYLIDAANPPFHAPLKYCTIISKEYLSSATS